MNTSKDLPASALSSCKWYNCVNPDWFRSAPSAQPEFSTPETLPGFSITRTFGWENKIPPNKKGKGGCTLQGVFFWVPSHIVKLLLGGFFYEPIRTSCWSNCDFVCVYLGDFNIFQQIPPSGLLLDSFTTSGTPKNSHKGYQRSCIYLP